MHAHETSRPSVAVREHGLVSFTVAPSQMAGVQGAARGADAGGRGHFVRPLFNGREHADGGVCTRAQGAWAAGRYLSSASYSPLVHPQPKEVLFEGSFEQQVAEWEVGREEDMAALFSHFSPRFVWLE